MRFGPTPHPWNSDSLHPRCGTNDQKKQAKPSPGITITDLEQGPISGLQAAPAVDGLEPLLEDRDAAWKFCGQMILNVDGYDADPHELVDVPEVREFLTNRNDRSRSTGIHTPA